LVVVDLMDFAVSAVEVLGGDVVADADSVTDAKLGHGRGGALVVDDLPSAVDRLDENGQLGVGLS